MPSLPLLLTYITTVLAWQQPFPSRCLTALSATTQSATDVLRLALQKPAKTLAVSLEYLPNNPLPASDLAVLSMQLRKERCASIFTSDTPSLSEIAREQASARGDFPGPCPVVYCGEDVEGAVEAGASAVVLGVDAPVPEETGVIWRVSSPDDVAEVPGADAFLVEGSDAEATIASLPPNSLIIAALDAMQPNGAEILQGKRLRKMVCSSVLLKNAIVGDSEDLEYARFAVKGLTSKASKEFNFSGLTGSANGHFGGVASSDSSGWKRNLSEQ